MKKKLRELHGLNSFLAKDNFKHLVKKEQPDALFIIGLNKEKTAFKEAKKVGMPVIAVCNTNCNPALVDYVIPGRATVKSEVSETKNNQPSPSDNGEIKQLKSELSSLKSELNSLQDNPKKSQLESQLSSLESEVKNLTKGEHDKSTIKELEREIKEIKEKIKNDKREDGPPPYTPPTDEDQLQFTVYYFAELGQNHM
ncbi:10142_t:CDS:2 [Paraglomus brasilianum]|uniref:10142_t:CDS:1 n=1 Tax=Paraglomus brasilianum TaxID=144538 RepID=A0A9N9DUY1_9GLOM|nr:10142_t:CDS:2 [Paraglomus brasilianum]